jgi:hypothetical protein
MMQMVGSAVSGAMRGLVAGLWQRWLEFERLRHDEKALAHVLLLELRRNLSLIDVLRLDDDEAQDSDGFRIVATGLETEVLEQLFMPDKYSRALLEELSKIELSDDEGDLGSSVPVKNVLMSLYVRMTSLKKLAELPRDLDGVRRIHYRTRLHRIQLDLIHVIQELERRVGDL